jgi:molybdopterin molybdotransferase
MLTVEEALERLLAQSAPMTAVEQVDTMDAAGRVLAEPQLARVSVPPMDNAQMDGYAVRCADLHQVPRSLPVSQRVAAGQAAAPLQPGTVARIFTGAPLPEGADAVVMQEHAIPQDGAVTFQDRPRVGQWIRRAGLDIAAGSEILLQGDRLGAVQLGLAAAAGIAAVPVFRRLRVAVFFTGDELVMPGQPLPPGRIYNSNRFMLRTLLQGLGCQVTDLGMVPDALEATREALRTAARGSDLIVTSGGVSVGEEDHVKAAVQAEGRLDLWQIAMKPGKPLAFGRVGDVPFLGLPGNPVSSLVTFLLLGAPLVRRLQGRSRLLTLHEVPAQWLRAEFDHPHADKRREFLRARRTRDGGVETFSNQDSAALSACAWADGLIDTPAQKPVLRGETVRFLPFSELSA